MAIYDLNSIYNFIEDDIKLEKFEDLLVDIKGIELYEADEFDFYNTKGDEHIDSSPFVIMLVL